MGAAKSMNMFASVATAASAAKAKSSPRPQLVRELIKSFCLPCSDIKSHQYFLHRRVETDEVQPAD